MVAHERAHQIRLKLVLSGKRRHGATHAPRGQHIAHLEIKREVKLGVEQIVANIFIQQSDIATERFTDHIKCNPRVGKKRVGGRTKILDELDGHVLDGIDAETVHTCFLDEPDGVFHHQLARIGVVIIDVGQIRREPARFRVVVPVVIIIAYFFIFSRPVKPVRMF